MNTIQLLFNSVYHNKYIRDKIFKSIQDNRLGGKRYEDVVSLDWVIENKQWGILKDKLDRGEYLLIDMQSMNSIAKIPDTKLFIQTFDRFRRYFTQSFPTHLLHVATKYNNRGVFEYLVKEGYRGYPVLIFDSLWGKKLIGVDFVKYLLDLYKDTCYSEAKLLSLNIRGAIQANNLEILQYIIDQFNIVHKNKRLIRNSVILNDQLVYFDLACLVGNLEILKLVQLYFSTPALEKNPSKKWFELAFKHTEMFKYLLDRYRDRVQREWMVAIGGAMVSKRAYQSFLMIKEYDLIEQVHGDHFQQLIALEAFKQGEMGWYETFKNDSCKISQLDISDVKDAFNGGIERVESLYKMGIKIGQYCIIDSAKATARQQRESIEIVDFLWNHYQLDPFVFFDNLLHVCVEIKSIKLLELLIQKKSLNQKMNSQEHTIFWDGLLAHRRNQNFTKVLLHSFTLSIECVMEGMKESIKNENIEIFKLVYTNNRRIVNIDRLFPYAAAHSLEILEFMIQQHPYHKNDVLCRSKSIEIVDLLLNNGYKVSQEMFNSQCTTSNVDVIVYLLQQLQQQGPVKIHHSFLIDAITQHHLSLFSILLDHTQLKHPKILETIGKTGNLLMLQIYFKRFGSTGYYSGCYDHAMTYGNLDIVCFLMEHIDTSWQSLPHQLTLRQVFHSKATWILEYYRNEILKPNSLFSSLFRVEKNFFKKNLHLFAMSTPEAEEFIEYLDSFSTGSRNSVFSFLWG
ncbi:hypothetical protein CYY_001194 [Polysphondylium violaceum]|uniref:Ankyrin repeat-containing protein n=1 Tax=Polysphondylium violaceum TaxID=133409 RepID=A0A8J4Q1G1_9MYCE|nr:hypothetical protein CYY_001194 [Polysphondylium violaceum]